MCIRFSVTQRTIKKRRGVKTDQFFSKLGAEQTCRIRKPRFLEEGPRQKLSLTRSGVEAKEENFLSPLFFVLKGGGTASFCAPSPPLVMPRLVYPHTKKHKRVCRIEKLVFGRRTMLRGITQMAVDMFK